MGLLNQMLEADGHYVAKVTAARARRERKKAEDYIWKARLSVSDFTSLHDCPKKIVERRMGKKNAFSHKTAAKLDLGIEIHSSYQNAAMDSAGLKWAKPSGLHPELMERLERTWPEVPVGWFYEGEWIIAGVMDDVQNYQGRPSVVELKTVNISPEDFKYRFDKLITNAPDKAKHRHQLKTYLYLARDHYPGFKLGPGELIYINTRLEAGEATRERTIWIRLDDGDEEKFELQFKEAALQVHAALKEEELACGYKFCKEHGF